MIIPVSWEGTFTFREQAEFEAVADKHYTTFIQKAYNFEKATNPRAPESESFRVLMGRVYPEAVLSECMGKCSIDVGQCPAAGERGWPDLLRECAASCGFANPESAILVGITPPSLTGVCGLAQGLAVIVEIGKVDFGEEAIFAHEFGHVFYNFCDEYAYDTGSSNWKTQNEAGKACPNAYPLCCADHPDWVGKEVEYTQYLASHTIGKNCFPEGKEPPLAENNLCMGSPCTPVEGKSYCRSLYGAVITQDFVNTHFDGSLEMQYPLPAPSP